MLLLNLLCIGLPSALVLSLCARRLRRAKERFGGLFLMGMAALVLVLLVGLLLRWITDNALQFSIRGKALWRSFVLSGALEECSKLVLFLLWWRRSAHSRSAGVALAAATTIALAFALLENSWYLIDTPAISILRGFAVAGLHVCASALATVWIVARKRLPQRALGLIAAIGLHGLYDLLLMQQRVWLVALLLTVGFTGAVAAWASIASSRP